ncbi:hypothetical protein [Ferrovum sp.]|uniref:hypothetical protein n=1 Tax=Ferrovum sp. TaxID=2609467 RepID=UPI0026295C5C|nr:hypothetical protein [Ferrovum sp.]
MQIMRARAGQRFFCAAHNSEHYVELPTTEPGWAGGTGRRTKPQAHAGGKAQRRAAARQAGRMPGLPVPPRKRQRREPKPNETTEPVAKHPAAFGYGTAQPARSRKPLAPSFWGEGRRGGERAETEGTARNEGTEGSAQVAKAALWP